VVTVKPVPVASHALPPQPARPTATATAAPVKKVAPLAVTPALPKVNIPAVEKGGWRCDWHRLAVDIGSHNWQRLVVSCNRVLSYGRIQFKNSFIIFMWDIPL